MRQPKSGKLLNPLTRKLHIGGDEWTYRILRGADILVMPPSRDRKIRIRGTDLFDMTPDDIERGLWKRWLSVTPRKIKSYILEHLIQHGPLV